MDRETKDDLFSQVELFSYALTTVQEDYVEKTGSKELIYGALKGMLSALDPHSQFLPPDEYKELKTETEGKFGGIGIEISVKDGLLTVISPIEGTPAWNAGVKAADRIVRINDEVTKDMSLNDAVKLLRGEPGSDVTITVLRESEFVIKDITITRGIIQYQDVKDVQILEDNIGYIRLSEFREKSGKAFRDGLDQLKAMGANALVVDLRNNPGGLLNVAIEITEDFLPEGTVVVSTKGRRASQNAVVYSQNTDHLIDWPLVVLINEGSASGSEILAGALKDNKRAIIVGEKSFGKGSVQSVIPMPDGSGLRLTTSKYFTPAGVSIHEKGIEPDVVVKYQPKKETERDEREKKIEEIFDNLEEQTKDKQEEKEKLKEEKQVKRTKESLLEDNQVRAAIDILKGVRVYKQFGDPSVFITSNIEPKEEPTIKK
jgi:carboxyl-terminal processing protease